MQLLLYIFYDKNNLYKFVTSKCFLVPITTALSTRIYYSIVPLFIVPSKILRIQNCTCVRSFELTQSFTIAVHVYIEVYSMDRIYPGADSVGACSAAGCWGMYRRFIRSPIILRTLQHTYVTRERCPLLYILSLPYDLYR